MFLNNLLHGHGKLINTDGSCQEGTFSEGLACGYFKHVYTNGTINEGYRVNGEWVGPIKGTFPGGGSMESAYLDDKLHGPCTLRMENGTVIEGQHKNGVQCGRWVAKYMADGTIFVLDYDATDTEFAV